MYRLRRTSAHIKLLRDLCVARKQWLTSVEFEDAVAACNLLPGPASTQLAIFCAWRVRGRPGALLGGAAFIIPGLVIILALTALFLEGAAPRAVLAAAAGASSAVAAVAVHAAAGLLPASWRRASESGGTARLRWFAYLVSGLIATATIGPWLVVVLLACGAFEIASRRQSRDTGRAAAIAPTPLLAIGALSAGTLVSLIWVALKIGALSYGGGFVIIPLMQNDAVNSYHWMTSGQFLTAVALGQITPGPVVQTVAVVGYAAAGVLGGVVAAIVAFTPSFTFVLLGARHFDQLRNNRHRASLSRRRRASRHRRHSRLGDHPRPRTDRAVAIRRPRRRLLLLVSRRGVVLTLLAAAAAGTILVSAGVALPR